MGKSVLVAEVDDKDAVVWVWVSSADRRSARPIMPGADTFDSLGDCETFGAHREKIYEWIARAN